MPQLLWHVEIACSSHVNFADPQAPHDFLHRDLGWLPTLGSQFHVDGHEYRALSREYHAEIGRSGCMESLYLGSDDLLILQLPTVWHALAILGLAVPGLRHNTLQHVDEILGFRLSGRGTADD